MMVMVRRESLSAAMCGDDGSTWYGCDMAVVEYEWSTRDGQDSRSSASGGRMVVVEE